MTFDPETYSITIRKETIDGEVCFVARVAEFPNLSAYETSVDEARAIILDAITTIQQIATEEGAPFPPPNPSPEEDFNGRFTLRMPKTLHARTARLAENDGVSLNQFLVTAISTYVGEIDGLARAANQITATIYQALYLKASQQASMPSGTERFHIQHHGVGLTTSLTSPGIYVPSNTEKVLAHA
jgi:predicted HicB family RNase H-like nuclease